MKPLLGASPEVSGRVAFFYFRPGGRGIRPEKLRLFIVKSFYIRIKMILL